jgi:hypothetical protein
MSSSHLQFEVLQPVLLDLGPGFLREHGEVSDEGGGQQTVKGEVSQVSLQALVLQT